MLDVSITLADGCAPMHLRCHNYESIQCTLQILEDLIETAKVNHQCQSFLLAASAPQSVREYIASDRQLRKYEAMFAHVKQWSALFNSTFNELVALCKGNQSDALYLYAQLHPVSAAQ